MITYIFFTVFHSWKKYTVNQLFSSKCQYIKLVILRFLCLRVHMVERKFTAAQKAGTAAARAR